LFAFSNKNKVSSAGTLLLSPAKMKASYSSPALSSMSNQSKDTITTSIPIKSSQTINLPSQSPPTQSPPSLLIEKDKEGM
jgi:hypothetical protein